MLPSGCSTLHINSFFPAAASAANGFGVPGERVTLPGVGGANPCNEEPDNTIDELRRIAIRIGTISVTRIGTILRFESSRLRFKHGTKYRFLARICVFARTGLGGLQQHRSSDTNFFLPPAAAWRTILQKNKQKIKKKQ